MAKEKTMEGRTVAHSAVTMSQLIGPMQAGRSGFAHGGEIMKLMDTAAGVVALRHSHHIAVTARVDGINFFRPIKVHDLVIVNAYLTFVGKSSMDVRVEVFAEDIIGEMRRHALTAHFIMVALDDHDKPTEVPPLILSSEEEKELWEKGKRRHETCKGEIMIDVEDFKVCREEPLF
jgi:acyl-CoA hydrolase